MKNLQHLRLKTRNSNEGTLRNKDSWTIFNLRKKPDRKILVLLFTSAFYSREAMLCNWLELPDSINFIAPVREQKAEL